MSSTSHTTLSSPSFRLFLDALDAYTQQTGINLATSISANELRDYNSPDEVLQLLQQKSMPFTEHRDANRKLTTLLIPIVRVLHAFSGVLGEGIGLVPFPPANAIFVGIGVLLSAAGGVSTTYDSLVDLFEVIGNFLERLSIYAEIPATGRMPDLIMKIMVEVLSVLSLATKQVKQGRFKKFGKKLLGDSDVEAVLHRLDRLTMEEARMTAAETLEVVHGLVNNMKFVMDDKASTNDIRQSLVMMHETINEINKAKRDELIRNLRQWLSPPDPSPNHNVARDAHHSGTSAWFFQGNTFQEWKSTGSLMWIHGIPGSGKSILCSSIIQDVKGLCDLGLATMVYFYFDSKDSGKQDARGFLTSLLAQLCSQSDVFYNVIAQLYSSHDGGLRQPSYGILVQCLKQILQLPGQGPIYIIADALDECPNSLEIKRPRGQVLELLEELAGLYLPNLHICVASRREANIRVTLEPLADHLVSLHDESDQKRDIIAYITSVVNSDRSMRSWRSEDKELVINTLSEKARGMFRWVTCQLEVLRRCLQRDIRRVLSELPGALDETYGRCLREIDEEDWEYAHRLFQCLIVSVRPLRTEELVEVLAVDLVESNPELRVYIRPADPIDAILSKCHSLVAINDLDGSQVVQFAHFSVGQFLTSTRLAIARKSISRYHVLLSPAHALLAQICLCVLLQLDDRIDTICVKDFPLADYAARHWVHHAQFEDVLPRIHNDMEQLFDPHKPHFAAWIWIHNLDDGLSHRSMLAERPSQPGATQLYYAALLGFDDLAEWLIIMQLQDINIQGGFYQTPLSAASAKGHLHVAQLLILHGANPDTRDNWDWTPLHVASENGHLEVSKLLLEHGADAMPRDNRGWTPLHRALQGGHLEVARLLVAHGADVNSRDDWNWTPLHWTSQQGHHKSTQLLLERGADPNAQDNLNWTPLHWASKRGHKEVVQVLLRCDADVSARDNWGWTPLQVAAGEGYLKIVQSLLNYGADPRTLASDRYIPYQRALQGGYLEVARVLSEYGTDT